MAVRPLTLWAFVDCYAENLYLYVNYNNCKIIKVITCTVYCKFFHVRPGNESSEMCWSFSIQRLETSGINHRSAVTKLYHKYAL